MFDTGGRTIARNTLAGGMIYENKPAETGLFVVRLTGEEGVMHQKIIIFHQQ